MTYSEKLKDPRWRNFRDDFVERHEPEDGYCPECGADSGTNPRWHVHHRRYFKGREPWEYDDEDLRLICEHCHEELHALEERMRNVIRAMAPQSNLELEAVIVELEALTDPHTMRVALARAKNELRNVRYSFAT